MTESSGGDRYLELDGARLRWRMAGTGPAIALLHGWALDLGSWDALTPHLTPHFTVLRFDRRGFGLSEGIPDIHRNAEDLRALLDAAGIRRVALLGMSQGARLALHFARNHAAYTRALLLDGAPAIEAESELPLSLYRKRLDKEGIASLQAQILLHPLMQLQGAQPEARRMLVAAVQHYRGLDLQHPAIRARAPDLGQVSVPTLVINGSLDSKERREAGHSLQSSIPRALRVELAGAGHLALLDAPQAYAQAVLAFLHDLPP